MNLNNPLRVTDNNTMNSLHICMIEQVQRGEQASCNLLYCAIKLGFIYVYLIVIFGNKIKENVIKSVDNKNQTAKRKKTYLLL